MDYEGKKYGKVGGRYVELEDEPAMDDDENSGIKFWIEEEDGVQNRLSLWCSRNDKTATGINFPEEELINLKKCIDGYLMKTVKNNLPVKAVLIYYADGSLVRSGDIVRITDDDGIDPFEIVLHNGEWTDNNQHLDGSDNILVWAVIWDGNRMTNAKKVG